MNRVAAYIRETRSELKFVKWPTRSQAIAFTLLVVAISIFIAFYLGLFDYVFSLLLTKFIL